MRWLSDIPAPVYWSLFGVAAASWLIGAVWFAYEIRHAADEPFFAGTDDAPLFVPVEWEWPSHSPEASR